MVFRENKALKSYEKLHQCIIWRRAELIGDAFGRRMTKRATQPPDPERPEKFIL